MTTLDSKEIQINAVIVLFSKGEITKALEAVQDLLKEYPNEPVLFNISGACYAGLGQFDLALKDYAKAILIKPDYAKAHFNLAGTLEDLDQLEDAVNSYKKALEIEPDYAEAFNNLGNVFKELEQNDAAVQSYKDALLINPEYVEAQFSLGIMLQDLGNPEAAIECYEAVLSIMPNFADAYNNLGTSFLDLGQFNEAVRSYKSLLKIKPESVEAINNLGIAFYKLHQFEDAIECYERAISFQSDFAETYNNKGIVLLDLGQFKKAANSYKQALKISPDFFEAINNLGIAFYKLHHFDDAIDCYEKAISFKPDFVDAYANLASVLKDLKRFDEALEIYESEIIQNSNLDFILGEILYIKMHLCIWDDLSIRLNELTNKINNGEKVISPFILLALIDDPEIQRKAAEIYIDNKFQNNDVLPSIGDYSKHSKIRIGYFSADFREHPVSSLTAELYEAHDRNQFEIYAFSFGPNTNDEMNLRIKAGVDHFHDVQSMSHKEIVMLSRSFEIDIAIDLGGFTQNARTEIFAMSVAPIQASYIGVLSTMGADYYDYLLAGQGMIPEINQKYFTEKIVYLPSYQVNDSKELLPDKTFTKRELGLPEKGFVFCCFNHTYKITPAALDSWARILAEVKESVLFIYVDNDIAKTNLIKEIVTRNINADRLIFGERLAKSDYLARYKAADLFLDTRPYNAGTTGSDALRMGLPVLTLEGNSFNSREAATILRSINLPELITSSDKEYESLAIELGNNPEKIKLIKEKLVSNLSISPLYNTPLFTKNLESAYTKMYHRYKQGLKPDHIYL